MLTPENVLKRTRKINEHLEQDENGDALDVVSELVALFGDVCTQWASDLDMLNDARAAMRLMSSAEEGLGFHIRGDDWIYEAVASLLARADELLELSTGAPQGVDSDLPLGEQLDQIDARVAQLEARRLEVYRASLEAPAENKACTDALSRMILNMGEDRPSSGFPWEVRAVAWDDSNHPARKEPQLVAVRPVDDEKTYVGILVGDLPLGVGTTFNRESGVLHLEVGHHNPAIVVPALERVVMGCGSWWKPIESEEQLKQITDEDIEDVWYVKALMGAE